MKGSSAKKLTPKKLTVSELKRIIVKMVPRLIKKDPELRQFIERVTSPKFADKKKTEDRIERILEELRRDREENARRWKETQEEDRRKWEENERRWKETQEEDRRKWEENARRWKEAQEEDRRKWEEAKEEDRRKWEENRKEIRILLERIDKLQRLYETGIGALGSRWGLRAESSFRDAMKEILEDLLPLKVERYTTLDQEGIVFGSPDQVELDLIIKDGVLYVAEIKSSVSKGDVAAFLRKVQLYEREKGRVVDKKIIISPMVDPRAKKLAASAGIRIFNHPDEVELND